MRKRHGFTLIEIVVVLAIVSLLLAMATFATRAIMVQQRISTTATRLATVDAALLQFVMVQKRLPCPADGSIATGQPGAGVEIGRSAAGCDTATIKQIRGVVPWVTLGITEGDATDGWLRRITYRTDPNLASDNAMDMSYCDPASQAPIGATASCNQSCLSTSLTSCTAPQSFLLNKGLPVRNTSGTVVMNPASVPATGAAYVLISHGETGGGAYLNSGSLATSTTTDGGQERNNYASLAYDAGTSFFVDDSIVDIPGATHFDDMLSHPTILGVISKAALGPRSH